MSFCSLTSCSIRERGYTSVMSSLGREGGREGREGGREGREGGREGEREGGREGGREGWRERGGMEGKGRWKESRENVERMEQIERGGKRRDKSSITVTILPTM